MENAADTLRIRGINSTVLKFVAVIAMFIDHVSAALIARVILYGGYSETLYGIYYAMRMIGRLAFPIYCFLIVEGFQKTRSRARYAMRLGIFSLISEIPFDLAFKAEVLEFHYQNVFFTLFLGLLALCCYDFISKQELPKVVKWLLDGLALTALVAVAELIRCDYGGMGVLAITAMYLLRRYKAAAMAAGCLVLALLNGNEYPAFLALIPAVLYDGSKGVGWKYFFYFFYPVHLLLLWLIAFCMGIAWIAVI